MTRLLCALVLLSSFAAFVRADEDDDEKLKKMIRRLDPGVKVDLRRQAASDLARLGAQAKPALAALVRAMQKDPDAKVRRLAVYAVKQIGAEAKSAIPKVIDVFKTDADPDVRCIAA